LHSTSSTTILTTLDMVDKIEASETDALEKKDLLVLFWVHG